MDHGVSCDGRFLEGFTWRTLDAEPAACKVNSNLNWSALRAIIGLLVLLLTPPRISDYLESLFNTFGTIFLRLATE